MGKCLPGKTENEVQMFLKENPNWRPLKEMLEVEAFCENQYLGEKWWDAW